MSSKIDSIFRLTWLHYDNEESYFFIGPAKVSQEEFQKICNELVPQAAKLAIETELKNKELTGYIGWNNITECIHLLLNEKGFTAFIPKEASQNGSVIIDHKYQNDNSKLGPMFETVRYYNNLIGEGKSGQEIEQIMRLQAFW